MTYSPPAYGLPEPQVLSSATDDICSTASLAGGAGGSSAWSANLAYFLPVVVRQRRTYVKAWWLNGSAVAGNVDVGIYTISGTTATRIVASTAEAQATVSVMQVAATFTATTLSPGLYYLALSASSGSAAFWRISLQNAIMGAACGGYQAASSAHPLPSTATVASLVQTAVIPVFGFSEVAAI